MSFFFFYEEWILNWILNHLEKTTSIINKVLCVFWKFTISEVQMFSYNNNIHVCTFVVQNLFKPIYRSNNHMSMLLRSSIGAKLPFGLKQQTVEVCSLSLLPLSVSMSQLCPTVHCTVASIKHAPKRIKSNSSSNLNPHCLTKRGRTSVN